MEDSGEKEQYSKMSIFGRICQHCTTREQATFTLNHHQTTTPDKQQTTREFTKNNASEFFQNQRTQINAQRLQKEKISVPRTNQTQDPPTLCSKQQEARGLHSVSAPFFQKSAHHSKDFFKSAILKQHKIQRPSSSLFQIARGSGATLSECTFFFEKSARHQEDFFRTKLLQGIMTKRSRTELYPSSF